MCTSGATPETHHLTSGSKVANLSIATNQGYIDKRSGGRARRPHRVAPHRHHPCRVLRHVREPCRLSCHKDTLRLGEQHDAGRAVPPRKAAVVNPHVWCGEVDVAVVELEDTPVLKPNSDGAAPDRPELGRSTPDEAVTFLVAALLALWPVMLPSCGGGTAVSSVLRDAVSRAGRAPCECPARRYR